MCKVDVAINQQHNDVIHIYIYHAWKVFHEWTSLDYNVHSDTYT